MPQAVSDNKIIAALDVKFRDARLTLDSAAGVDSFDKIIDEDYNSHIRKMSCPQGRVLQRAYTFTNAINFVFEDVKSHC